MIEIGAPSPHDADEEKARWDEEAEAHYAAEEQAQLEQIAHEIEADLQRLEEAAR